MNLVKHILPFEDRNLILVCTPSLDRNGELSSMEFFISDLEQMKSHSEEIKSKNIKNLYEKFSDLQVFYNMIKFKKPNLNFENETFTLNYTTPIFSVQL